MKEQWKDNEWMKEKSWKEFRETGLLWFVNTTLHAFGWAITLEFDENMNVVRAYPSRVRYRGFDEKTNDKGYSNVGKYLKDNAEELYKESGLE